MTEQSQPDGRRWRAPVVVLVAVLAVVLVVTGGVALVTEGLPRQSGSLQPSPPPTQPASADGFPTEMLGLRVVSVGEALDWANSGQVDGRAIAVRGWWLTDFAWSCPWAGRDPLPIEGYCTTDYLSSAPYARYTCARTIPDGSGECHGNPAPPGVQVMPAMTLHETAGAAGLNRVPDAHFGKGGVPVVAILHVGDPRSRQCPAGSQKTCAAKALVDRVAWAGGDQVEGWPPVDLVTALAPEEVIAASGWDGSVLSAFAVRLGDAWMIDPRFHGVGDDSVWVVRGLSADAAEVPEDPSRAVDVRVVDDATSRVLFAGRLSPGQDYAPARLLVQATEPVDAAGNDLAVYYRIETSAAMPVGLLEVRLGGTIQSDGAASRSAAAPALLDPGDYVVRVWRGPVSGGGHAHFNECTRQVSVAALGEVVIETAFPERGACQFGPQTFVSPFNQ